MVCVLGLRLPWALALNGGPFVSRDTTVAGEARTRALGPFYESRQGPDGRTLWALRPFYSTLADPSDARVERNALWPLWIGKHLEERSQWQCAVFMHWRDHDRNDPQSQYAFWILPLYFQGRDAAGTPYAALFPVGGHIRDFLGRDEIRFALFPLFGYSRVNDVRTHSYLWPIVSSTAGHGHDRFRVAPLYGYSRLRSEYDKRFILWPIWTSARYGYEGALGSSWIVFPLVGHARLIDQNTWWIIPPLFRVSHGDQMNLTHGPWPLYQKSSGEIAKLYVFPLWGHKTIGDRESGFFLWPLGLSANHPEGDVQCRRTAFLPILWSETKTRRTAAEEPQTPAAGPEARTLKIWPLFSYERNRAHSQLRIPSLFPFKDFKPIDRNYAPFWTLYTRSADGAIREDELLWGLAHYRRSDTQMQALSLFPLFEVARDASADTARWALLKGLVGRARTGDRTTWRALYVLRWSRNRPDPVSAVTDSTE